MSQNEPVSVRILDREYTVGVEPAERDSLTAAARMLDARMREIRGNNRMAAVDRVAVLAALNLAHELHLMRDELAQQQQRFQSAMNDLNRRLDSAIDEGR
ncbi:MULTISPECIES: cell division protein ZapA [Stenotrophomonas]|uniref:Cell division protein ZapA n=2 Tax=Stenotrophomonas TaxID=40323 RepID=A0A0R0E7S7_9GAMM|nr:MULTISPECIES: cell division protein ZapA [Stenotrophomonas]MBN8799902.1 cell division protein ZapA [Stenotrophomonas nitritireducens]ODU43222.1 MAG: cell division ZapA family protein [Xanthomonadaceae bacterium SCN 69-123]OJY79501.1 MAG: cell division protein ZapA [Stenotrophomonas sp. 69-14]OZB54206.1 MAG: cell division protein ZapA [Stenotrophomonas sp. 14-69-23]ALJ29205.1 Cell division protein ZapA [Stenotrophomonas acidaminiphila]